MYLSNFWMSLVLAERFGSDTFESCVSTRSFKFAKFKLAVLVITNEELRALSYVYTTELFGGTAFYYYSNGATLFYGCFLFCSTILICFPPIVFGLSYCLGEDNKVLLGFFFTFYLLALATGDYIG